MNLAILGFANSIHTVRWVNALVMKGHEVHLYSQHPAHPLLDTAVVYHPLFWFNPFGYLLNVLQLKFLLKRQQAHVLHVHYATGYGLLGRLSRFSPLIISVWGSDVFAFPKLSFVHRSILTKNLLAANIICSTSAVMAQETRLYCPLADIRVIPFGIDSQQFKTVNRVQSEYIYIGTVKALTVDYGIDTLLKGFALLHQQADPSLQARLRLRIAGEGQQAQALQQLSQQLGIAELTTFSGQVAHDQVAAYLHDLSIYVAISRAESFGVAVLEASACALPVVVSNVGGLPEVVKDQHTGLCIDADDPQQLATALLFLLNHPQQAQQFGLAGRQWVKQQYEWANNVHQMASVYHSLQ